MRQRLTDGQRIERTVRRQRGRSDLRARLRASFYTTELEDVSVDAIRVRDDATCHLCGLWVDVGEQTLDHVIPLVRGGSHTYDNIKLAHRECNSRKGAR